MVSVFDVAAHILKRVGPLDTMKLQKLVYYSQAWSLVWDGQPLFHESIEAWANGPVCPELYQAHRGDFQITSLPKGDPSILVAEQLETIEGVLKFYGSKSGWWLSELTHREHPWLDARNGLNPGDRGNTVISLASMAEYYGSLA